MGRWSTKNLLSSSSQESYHSHRENNMKLMFRALALHQSEFFLFSRGVIPQWQRMAPLQFSHILPQQAWCSIPDFRPKDLHCPQLPYPPVRNPYALWWTSSSRLKENPVLVKVLLFSFPQTPIEKVTNPACNGEDRNHCLSNEGKSLPWLQL